jgi:hypothetical protein
MAETPDQMHFRRMDQGSDADFAVLARVHEQNVAALPDLLMGMLNDLSADAAYPVDRCQHSLQAATRALRDGRDEEYVVCALLHDIGESLGPFNHGDVVAAILRVLRRRLSLGIHVDLRADGAPRAAQGVGAAGVTRWGG